MRCQRRRPIVTALPVLFLLALACWLPAHAEITLTGSRVIYDEAAGEAMLRLQQDGPAPAVVELWLDEGDEHATPESVNPPFVLTPTVALINPGRQQLVRIVRSRDELPRDRESVFWLNVLEKSREFVEQTPTHDGSPRLAFRARVKLFYRPSQLNLRPERAPELLQFTLARTLPDGPQLRVYNPSPYHVTFRDIGLRQGEGAPPLAELTATTPGERMVAPMSELTVTLEWVPGNSARTLPAQAEVAFNIINDYGALTPGTKTLAQ